MHFRFRMGIGMRRDARWSPDGKKIAFISNRGGTPELWLQDFPGGKQRHLVATERKYLKPHGRIEVTVIESDGKATPARVSVTDDAGKFFAPRYAWVSGADGYDRAESKFEPHDFPSSGTDAIKVPPGKMHVEVMKGFEFAFEKRDVDVRAGGVTKVAVRLKAIGADTSKPGSGGSSIRADLGRSDAAPVRLRGNAMIAAGGTAMAASAG